MLAWTSYFGDSWVNFSKQISEDSFCLDTETEVLHAECNGRKVATIAMSSFILNENIKSQSVPSKSFPPSAVSSLFNFGFYMIFGFLLIREQKVINYFVKTFVISTNS